MRGIGEWPESEVCVVGAGPAGLTLARALGRAGRTVTLLESGGYGPTGRAQQLNDGDVRGERYANLQQTRHRRIGGTTNIWNVEVDDQPGAKYAPLDRRDLAGWPLTWEDLEPFYHEAQEVCGLGPFAYEAAAWATARRQPFELSGTGLTSRVYQFGSAERFARELVAELAGMENVRICTSATVGGLAIDTHARRVRAVRVMESTGKAVEIAARRVVLACGAIENARLLLLTGVPEGAASGWLGRGFMEHARDFSLTLVPSSREIFGRAGFYDLFTASDGTRVGGRLALTDDALDRFDLPNASLTLIPGRASNGRPSRMKRLLGRLNAFGGGRRQGRYGWSTLNTPASEFDVFKVVLNLEQRPDPRNRVELGTRRDRFDNPLPALCLEWSVEEQQRLDRLRELLCEWFRTAELGSLQLERGRRPDLRAHHHAGTTRMAEHPEDGVVNPDGAVFGMENLYVTGASLFPSAGFANPTLSVVALAVRLARHLADEAG